MLRIVQSITEAGGVLFYVRGLYFYTVLSTCNQSKPICILIARVSNVQLFKHSEEDTQVKRTHKWHTREIYTDILIVVHTPASY